MNKKIYEKYIKTPSFVLAMQWKGDNLKDVMSFLQIDDIGHNRHTGDIWASLSNGVLKASKGYYIIKEARNTYYSCDPIIFEKIYTIKEK